MSLEKDVEDLTLCSRACAIDGYIWNSKDHDLLLKVLNQLTPRNYSSSELIEGSEVLSAIPSEEFWVIFYANDETGLFLCAVQGEETAKRVADAFQEALGQPNEEAWNYLPADAGWQRGPLNCHRTRISSGVDIIRTFQFLVDKRTQPS